MAAGEVTSALHKLSPGDKVGVRAPLGNYFPYNDWKGKDVFFVGGGIGMAPIRTIMLHLLEHKADYGKISLLYGARSPKDMAFSYELDGTIEEKIDAICRRIYHADGVMLTPNAKKQAQKLTELIEALPE